MKDKNKKDFGCVKSFPQCIQWNLGDIEVLGIENGQYLDEIIWAIACKIKEVTEPLDLSTVSLQCIIDKLDAEEPATKSIQTILKLLIDNECKLKDLIDDLQAQINGDSTVLSLNLRCLAQNDGYGNPIPYNEQSVLQTLINEVCNIKTSITYLSGKVVDLQAQIDALPGPYTLPSVSSCLYTNVPLSQAINLVAIDYCGFRSKIGTNTEIDTAISRQPSSLNTKFSGNPNFIQNPTNLAQSDNNQWIALEDALNRLAAIEGTCCAPSCDKVKVGFVYSFENASKELTLSFTSGAGTFIPSGFEDCGSEFTIKNCDGDVILTTVQAIENDVDIVLTLPSGVCISTLTVSIKTKFCLRDSDNLLLMTCRDCVSKVIKISSECCTLTNPGTENVIMTYSMVVAN